LICVGSDNSSILLSPCEHVGEQTGGILILLTRDKSASGGIRAGATGLPAGSVEQAVSCASTSISDISISLCCITLFNSIINYPLGGLRPITFDFPLLTFRCERFLRNIGFKLAQLRAR
jgi:hypothetical protein